MDDIPGFPDCDPNELSLDEAFGSHAIEYWVWSGTRLVPASSEQVATLREYEAMWRLTCRQRSKARASSWAGHGHGGQISPCWRWLNRVLAASGALFNVLHPRGRPPAETIAPIAAPEPTYGAASAPEQSAR